MLTITLTRGTPPKGTPKLGTPPPTYIYIYNVHVKGGEGIFFELRHQNSRLYREEGLGFRFQIAAYSNPGNPWFVLTKV